MQPTAYNPTTDFSQEEADGVSGRSTVRTAAVDVEFSNLATTIGQILANLSAIQRDDTGLRDLIVEPYALSASTLALIGSGGFTVSGAWLTGTAYAARTIVTNGTGTYVSASAHTSGVFATDLAAGKWVTLFNSASYAASGITFTPTGTIAASNVQAAIAEAASEAVQKSNNLSDVTAATARTNLSVPSIASVQASSSIIGTAGGGLDAITATFTPTLTAWANSQLLIVECAGANATTTPTFSADGLPAKTIVRPDGKALIAGDIAGANFRAMFMYDASLDQVILLNPSIVAVPYSAGTKQIFGWTYSNNTIDAVNDIDIAAGGGMDSTGASWMTGSALTKRLDAAWTAGNNGGGLDTGTIGNSDYYIWAIANSARAVDYLFSLSSTAPTMPSGYTYKRLIGWFNRVGGTIVAFHTYETEGGGIEFSWDAPQPDINLSNTLTTARRTDALRVPLNFSVVANITVFLFDATTEFAAWIWNPDVTDAAASNGSAFATFRSISTTTGILAPMRVRTGSTGLISARATLATVDTYQVTTNSFLWARRN